VPTPGPVSMSVSVSVPVPVSSASSSSLAASVSASASLGRSFSLLCVLVFFVLSLLSPSVSCTGDIQPIQPSALGSASDGEPGSSGVVEIPQSPPKEPPSHLVDEYTLQGTVPLEYFYVDDTNSGQATHFSFLTKSMESYITVAKSIISKLQTIMDGTGSLDHLAGNRRYPKDQWLHMSLFSPLPLVDLNQSAYKNISTPTFIDKLRIFGGRVLVVGSMSPWVEALFLASGASEVVTIEYNELTIEHPRARTVSAREFDEFYNCNGTEISSFDFIVAMSSLDHDGLGRYGDRLNPNGDLESMSKLRSVLKPGGVMFLTVPIGPDVVVFNLHRRYGRIRLNKLTEGFRIVHKFGWNEEMLDKPANWRQTYEPVLLLQKDLSFALDRCAQSEDTTRQEPEL
jgi:SAM-dependent methyltransferase